MNPAFIVLTKYVLDTLLERILSALLVSVVSKTYYPRLINAFIKNISLKAYKLKECNTKTSHIYKRNFCDFHNGKITETEWQSLFSKAKQQVNQALASQETGHFYLLFLTASIPYAIK